MIELLQSYLYFSSKTIESCTLLENQGYCNENYLLLAGGKKYIVRKLLRDDIDRNFEWKAHNLAYRQGITAEPLVYDEDHGFMVFEFLEGEHKGKLDKFELQLLAKILRKLHSVNIDAKPIALQIKNKTDEVLKAFETIDNYPEEYVLCHNDLNSHNIFFTKVAKLIDWEYAGVNDRYFDLACVCVEFELSDVMQEVFLDVYFKDEDFVLDKLEAYKVIYGVLCEEWMLYLSGTIIK